MKLSSILLFLLVCMVVGFPLVATIGGLYLAFKASVVLGILVLFLEPAPLVIGLVYLFTHVDLAQKIVDLFGGGF